MNTQRDWRSNFLEEYGAWELKSKKNAQNAGEGERTEIIIARFCQY